MSPWEKVRPIKQVSPDFFFLIGVIISNDFNLVRLFWKWKHVVIKTLRKTNLWRLIKDLIFSSKCNHKSFFYYQIFKWCASIRWKSIRKKNKDMSIYWFTIIFKAFNYEIRKKTFTKKKSNTAAHTLFDKTVHKAQDQMIKNVNYDYAWNSAPIIYLRQTKSFFHSFISSFQYHRR